MKPGAVADELSGLRARADAVAPCPPGAVEIKAVWTSQAVRQEVRRRKEEEGKELKGEVQGDRRRQEVKEEGEKSEEKDSDRMNGKHLMSAFRRPRGPEGTLWGHWPRSCGQGLQEGGLKRSLS